MSNRRLNEQRTVIYDELSTFTEQQWQYVVNRIEEDNQMKLRINADDLKKGVVIGEAAWYPVLVVDVVEKLSKSGDSNNYNVELKLLGPDKYEGVTVYRTFNEKAPGMAAPFFIACGAKTDADGKLIPGEFDFELTKGRKCSAYIKQRLFEGRPLNDVADFKPLA